MLIKAIKKTKFDRALLSNKNPFIRKSYSYLGQIFKHTSKKLINSEGNAILCNSFPKSGTHLLLQVLESLPQFYNYGTFLTNYSHLSNSVYSSNLIQRRVDNIVQNEIVSAHLYYDKLSSNFTNKIKKFFIYRDLRDVILSECYYISFTNKYHVLHSVFNRYNNINDKIKLAILGLDQTKYEKIYPNIRKRWMKYKGWLTDETTTCVKFEDIISFNLKALQKLCFDIETLRNQDNYAFTLDELRKSIDPNQSHTFRRGKIGQWKEIFSDENRSLVNELIGDIIVDLGYDN